MEIAPPDLSAARRFGSALLALACLAALAGCGKTVEGGPDGGEATAADEVVLTPQAAAEGRGRLHDESARAQSQARVVELRGTGAEPGRGGASPADDGPSPGAPTDAEVRNELREARAALTDFKKYLNTSAFLRTGARARVLSDGTAQAPRNAPEVVKRVILAANEIAKFPYKWGGGHGAWRDDGYDCSGSVSFALAGAGLLESPLTSGGFLEYGAPGTGRWITIYTNPGHMFMVVAGLRFDTSGRGRAGTRWQEAPRSLAGLEARRIPGL